MKFRGKNGYWCDSSHLSTHLEWWHCHLRNNCCWNSIKWQESPSIGGCGHGPLLSAWKRSCLYSFYLFPQPTNREKDHNSGDSFSQTETLWEMAFLMFSKSISASMNQYCQRPSMQTARDFISLMLDSSSHKTQTNNTISKLFMRLFKTFQGGAVKCEAWKGPVHWSRCWRHYSWTPVRIAPATKK